jgi:chaperone required for assembly of F1-ATPase
VLLALAVARREFTPEAAWDAAHVDEDFQMRVWGADMEALERRAKRYKEMQAAARLLRFVT